MADEPSPSSRPPSDPLQGWPEPPDRDGGTGSPARPPSAPPPGWAGATPPWARAAPQSGEDWARAAPQSGEDWARAAPQSGEDRARAAPQSGEDRARAAPQSGEDWGRAVPQSGEDWGPNGGKDPAHGARPSGEERARPPEWRRGGGAGPGAPAPAPRAGGGRGAPLRSRRGLVLVGGVVVLLLAAAIAVAVVSRDDGGGQATAGPGQVAKAAKGAVKAPAATAGRDVPLLDGRMVVTIPPGWEPLESSTDTASVRVELRAPGRDLVATLVTVALPAGSALDVILAVDGGTRFDVTTKAAGTVQATAVPGLAARVVWGAVRPNATFFLSLSVAALDGKDLDGAFLQKLFAEQVAPQVRYP